MGKERVSVFTYFHPSRNVNPIIILIVVGDFNFCLLCEKTVPAGRERENFYVLEKCQHGFCVNCLYKYVEKELTDRRENKEEKEEKGEEKEEKEEEKKKVEEDGEERIEQDGEKGEKEVKHEEEEKEGEKPKQLVCPLPGCGSEISIRDLSIGLAEFGERKKAEAAGEKKVIFATFRFVPRSCACSIPSYFADVSLFFNNRIFQMP